MLMKVCYWEWYSRNRKFVFNMWLKWLKMQQKADYPKELWSDDDAYEKKFFSQRKI